MNKTFAINLQLLGGVWILQTFPAIVAGLYTRWFHRWALLLGWAAAMVYGTVVAYNTPSATQAHFGGSVHNFPGTQTGIYIAFTAFLLNMVIAVVGTVVFRAIKLPAGVDRTSPDDYVADLGDAGVEPELDPEGATH